MQQGGQSQNAVIPLSLCWGVLSFRAPAARPKTNHFLTMLGVSVHLLAIRILISCLGLFGNMFLILTIIQTKLSRMKSFEMLLLELAAANLEEILIVNIYDMVILQTSTLRTDIWSCRVLKFLTVFGEITSILFTVLISIFRYQKVRDAGKRVNLPIYLDSIRAVWMVSGACVLFALLLSIPIFAINLESRAENATSNGVSCPPDFFQCSKNNCPLFNGLYKYLFILLCNLLPLIIVTVTGCLIITVLLRQRRTLTPELGGTGQFRVQNKGLRLQRSTIAVLTAMALFQIDWTLYLIFQLTLSPDDFLLWTEMEFFISTSYTSISPYVYGIGNNLFSFRNLLRK